MHRDRASSSTVVPAARSMSEMKTNLLLVLFNAWTLLLKRQVEHTTCKNLLQTLKILFWGNQPNLQQLWKRRLIKNCICIFTTVC